MINKFLTFQNGWMSGRLDGLAQNYNQPSQNKVVANILETHYLDTFSSKTSLERVFKEMYRMYS